MKKRIKKYCNKILLDLISGIHPAFWQILKRFEESNIFYKKNILRDSKVSSKAKLIPPFQLFESEVGEFTYIAENARITMTKIGKFCSIGPNFLCGYGIHPINGISTSPMFYSTKLQNGVTLSNEDKIVESMKIEIGNDVYIGMNVTVLDGVMIGDGSVIGAGAVVSKDIPPYSIAVGCPIRIVKSRFNQNQIDALLKIKWWDFDEENLKSVESMFFDLDNFIDKYSIQS